MKRNRKYCKYYKQRGAKTAYCMFLGRGLQCYKVCNMYVETRDNPALNLQNVSDYVCPKCGSKSVADWVHDNEMLCCACDHRWAN